MEQVGLKNLEKLWDGWSKTSVQTISSAPWECAAKNHSEAMQIQTVKEVEGLYEIVKANGGFTGPRKEE